MSGFTEEFAQRTLSSTAAASSQMTARSEQLTQEGFTGRGLGGRSFFSHYFPTNYNEIYHFVTFKVLKFESVTRTSALQSDQVLTANRKTQVERLLGTITLPLPNKLDTSYNANYPESNLSALGEVLATGVSNINIDVIRQAGEGAGGPTERVLNQVKALTQQMGGGSTIATAAGADILGGIGRRFGDGAAAGAANVTGIARNPHKIMLFGGVDFRTHSFSFNLVPKNKREADTIQRIIFAFKKHMLPKYGLGNVPDLVNRGAGDLLGLNNEQISAFTSGAAQAGAASRAFFEYPDVFIIEFNNMKKLFSVGESVMTGFTIDYHPQNYPAYVRSLSSPGEADPAAITISMTFKETDIVTRDQVEQFGR